MNKPILLIGRDQTDRLIEVIGLLAMLSMIILVIYYYQYLPDTIPNHYGWNGKPTGTGAKSDIWFLPLVGGIIYLVLILVNRYPHRLSYPVKITEMNAYFHYRLARKTGRIMAAFVAIVFCYITYGTIQTALGHQEGIGAWVVPLFLLVSTSIVIYFLVKSMNAK